MLRLVGNGAHIFSKLVPAVGNNTARIVIKQSDHTPILSETKLKGKRIVGQNSHVVMPISFAYCHNRIDNLHENMHTVICIDCNEFYDGIGVLSHAYDAGLEKNAFGIFMNTNNLSSQTLRIIGDMEHDVCNVLGYGWIRFDSNEEAVLAKLEYIYGQYMRKITIAHIEEDL